MSDDRVAYRSRGIATVAAWLDFLAAAEEIRLRREELSERLGRGLMTQQDGFGHGTRVVGASVLEGEKDGDVVADKTLRVSSKHGGVQMAVPNLRVKAGKALRDELHGLRMPAPDLPGMPGFHIGGGSGAFVGIRVHAPAISKWGHQVWVLWDSDGAPVDEAHWERVKLSEYYAAKEEAEGE